ncbi:hypothetical protein IMSAG013_01624 [Clostridiales bacterium]|nr:hypothetical protein IMSAG013_01624 [Clostridiales bacterium]
MCNTHQGYLYSVKAPPVKGVIRSKLSPNDISLPPAKGGFGKMETLRGASPLCWEGSCSNLYLPLLGKFM